MNATRDIEPNNDERIEARTWARGPVMQHTAENEMGYWQALANHRGDIEAADRRQLLLMSCLPALKLFRDDLVAEGFLHKLPGLERIIGEVEAEVG